MMRAASEAGGSSVADSVADELRALYAEHNPAKISDIPRLLSKYRGHEEDLLHAVKQKYRCSPATPPPAAEPNSSEFGSVEAEALLAELQDERRKREEAEGLLEAKGAIVTELMADIARL